MSHIAPSSLACLVILGMSTNPEGGTIYLDGEPFTPEDEVFVVGGIETMSYSTELLSKDYGIFFSDLCGLIVSGRMKDATTIGWWRDEDGTVHIDAGEAIRMVNHGIGWVSDLARQRGEKAVGFFKDGEYAATLYV